MAALTVTLTEALTLDGDDMGSTRVLTYSDVVYAFKQSLGIDTAAARTVLSLGTTVGGGDVIRSNFRYARFRNADSTNYITLGFVKTGGAAAYHRLDPGEFFILSHYAIDVDESGDPFGAWEDLDLVTAQANTGACKLEVFVATA